MTTALAAAGPSTRPRIAALSREAGVVAAGRPAPAEPGDRRRRRRPRRFLEAKLSSLHDPESLPGVAEAAERIVRAIREGRKIVIYGDYDVDGVCGTSVLWACLRLAGARATSTTTSRTGSRKATASTPRPSGSSPTSTGPTLVVTVDCGISAVAEARLARELGVELIVTDHHTIGAELPAADVLVHPRLPGSRYPFGDLCGAGVAFKLAWQICKSFGDGKKASPHLRDFLVRSLGLVALATVADVVPLDGENRILVRHGLAGIVADADGRAAGPDGGRRLPRQVAADDRARSGSASAPGSTRPGRLERAMRAVEMLTTDDPALAARARRGARPLQQPHARRSSRRSSPRPTR